MYVVLCIPGNGDEKLIPEVMMYFDDKPAAEAYARKSDRQSPYSCTNRHLVRELVRGSK